MRRYALYRIHYGLDFLGKSLDSIIDHVDKIFIFWSKQPWYKECKNLPPMNEDIKHFLSKEYNHSPGKISLWEREYAKPNEQFHKMYNELVQFMPRPDQILMMEPDMVWGDDIKKIWDIKEGETSFNQIEFWKSEEYYVPRHKPRPGPTLYNGVVPETKKGCFSDPKLIHPEYKCFNYGFCVSPETMAYKHEVAIQSSKYYGDSIPSKEWYQDKWLNWTPETTDLEISEKHKHYIKKALPYGPTKN